jgi:hypothetical protein
MNQKILRKGLKVWGRLVRDRDGNRCQWCGSPGNQPHHIVARSICCRLGWIDLRNGITLCFRCHIYRLKADPDSYIEMRDQWLMRKGMSYSELRTIFGQRQNKITDAELEMAINILTNNKKCVPLISTHKESL